MKVGAAITANGYVYATMIVAGRVKIGFTRDPRTRLTTLRREEGQRLCFVALAVGSLNQERLLKEALVAHVIWSEWYRPRRVGVARSIAKLRADTNMATLASVNAPTRQWTRAEAGGALRRLDSND